MMTVVYREVRFSVPRAESQTILKSIAHIGEDSGIAVTNDIKKIDLVSGMQGQIVVLRFSDALMDVLLFGLVLRNVDLDKCKDMEDINVMIVESM